MKRTMKKALALICIILAAVLVMSFGSFAASDCGDGNHKEGKRTVEATCTTAGYTETYCTVCGKLFSTKVIESALGHDYIDVDYYYTENGDSFLKKRDCNRCDFIEVDSGTYYSVEFINPWVTDTICPDINYTDLAKTWKSQQAALKYVLSGSTVSADDVKVNRQKDKAFGLYKLSGWSESKVDSGKFTAETLFDFGAPITANTTLYAAFTGIEDVHHTVRYINADGSRLSYDFEVYHGKKADDSLFNPQGTDANGKVIYNSNLLNIKEDNHRYYSFDRWNIDINNIYGTVSIKAIYNSHNKVYEYVFLNYKGEEVAREEVEYGTASQLNGDSEFAKKMDRPKDRTYIYAWKGGFSVQGENHITNIATLIPHMSAKDTRYKDDQYYKPTYLIPVYSQQLVEYVFNLTCIIPESEHDKEDYLDALVVQIVDDKGQLVSSGRTTNVGGEAVYKTKLRDSKYYIVTAVSEDEKYRAEKTIDRTFVYDIDKAVINATLNLEISEGYLEGLRCNCIHHNTLLRPIFVRILNILYNLFNVKYVCCDDMYATLGDVLAYTK